MQKSDVVLLGTSHVELGLSASILSAELSHEAGHPIHVFNLGIPFGDSIPFIEQCLTYNHIQNKPVIVDLYAPTGTKLSPFAQKVDQSTSLSAFFTVTEIWLRAATDWFFDPWLPRLTTSTALHDPVTVTPSRMMRGLPLAKLGQWR